MEVGHGVKNVKGVGDNVRNVEYDVDGVEMSRGLVMVYEMLRGCRNVVDDIGKVERVGDGV